MTHNVQVKQKKCKKQNVSTYKKSLHDREHPFVMISKELIRDKELTLQARMVLIFMLSLPPNFEIRHSYLQAEMGIGEKQLNNSIKCLIKNGYMKRERSRGHNRKGEFSAYCYEFAEFKIFSPYCLSQPAKGSMDFPSACIDTSNNEVSKKKNTKEAGTASLTEDAAALQSYFFSSLKNLGIEAPTRFTQREITATNKLAASHTKEELAKVIAFAHSSDFWKAHVHSVSYLLGKWDKLRIMAEKPQGEPARLESGPKIAEKMIKNTEILPGVTVEITSVGVEIGRDRGQFVPVQILFKSREFESQLAHELKKVQKPPKIQGL